MIYRHKVTTALVESNGSHHASIYLHAQSTQQRFSPLFFTNIKIRKNEGIVLKYCNLELKANQIHD